MLHPEQSRQTRKDQSDLPIGEIIMSTENITEIVKEKYGQAALRVTSGGSCCCGDPITSNLYGADQTGQLPDSAVLASLGCGNPTALARLNPGDIVLDLGP